MFQIKMMVNKSERIFIQNSETDREEPIININMSDGSSLSIVKLHIDLDDSYKYIIQHLCAKKDEKKYADLMGCIDVWERKNTQTMEKLVQKQLDAMEKKKITPL